MEEGLGVIVCICVTNDLCVCVFLMFSICVNVNGALVWRRGWV